MKTNFQKIFIGLSLSFIFYLGISFVSAQSNDVGSASQCSSIPSYSTNSNGGKSFATNNSILTRYINSSNALNLAINSQVICTGQYIAGWSTSLILDWKKNLCSSNGSTLQTHQTSLFTAFKSTKNYGYEWGFNSSDKVWNLQDLMKNAGCHDNRDCKLGVNTISNFLFCNVCKAINPSWTELTSLNPKTCEDTYVLTDNQLCCQPASCAGPTINKGGDNKYGAEPFQVTVDYSANTQGDMTFNTGKIIVEGGSASNYSILEKQITFTISPKADTNNITVKVGGDCAQLAGSPCPETTETFHRDVPCQSTKDWAQCSNSGDFNLGDSSIFTGFQKILGLGTGCLKGGEYISFCPDECTTWKVSNCEADYGSGWYENSSGCCVECGTNRHFDSDKDKCVCNTTSTCPSGEERSDVACKCKCDPKQKCCGILLNTVVPFIGDCIEITTQNDPGSSSDPNTSTLNQLNAFPFLMMGLSKILVTVILIFSFLIVIAAGLMMTTGVYSESNYKKGIEWIQKIVIALILLGSSGLILKLINPSFFGG